MSLTPQDNARSSFSQANPSRHVFQPNLPNNLPTPSPSQARATYRPTQGGIRPPNHQSPYATPYTPNNGQAGPPRPNGMYSSSILHHLIEEGIRVPLSSYYLYYTQALK